MAAWLSRMVSRVGGKGREVGGLRGPGYWVKRVDKEVRESGI